jgi:hypothetical protein
MRCVGTRVRRLRGFSRRRESEDTRALPLEQVIEMFLAAALRLSEVAALVP